MLNLLKMGTFFHKDSFILHFKIFQVTHGGRFLKPITHYDNLSLHSYMTSCHLFFSHLNQFYVFLCEDIDVRGVLQVYGMDLMLFHLPFWPMKP